MKFIIIFVCIGIFLSCAKQKNPQEEANLILANLQAKDEEIEKADWKKKAIESENDLKETSATRSKEFGLPDLQSLYLRNDDIEIRVIKLASFNERNINFQLEKIGGRWSANLIEKIIAKKNPPGKLFHRKLNEPKSGWETLYQKLISEKILTLPNGNEVGNEVCPDCEIFIVETKVKENYRIYDYHAPEYFKDIREAQQLVKIINLISEEFDLNVFDVDNFQAP
ncbi:MAG: hypothetical protein ABIP06_04960 [Pyrinomonadaceae bacterium]